MPEAGVIAVVPCRLRSSRLPGKALRPIHGVPAVERCLLNARAIPGVSRTVLATTTLAEDDPLEKLATAAGVDCVRGPEDDVLDRFLAAMDRFRPHTVIRATGDCPVVSYELLGRLLESHHAAGADSSFPENGFPVGINGEVYSAAALRELRRRRPRTNLSEYLVLYFKNNPKVFKLNEVALPPEFKRPWRLTLDEAPDLELLDRLAADLGAGRRPIAYDEVRGFFDRHPEAAAINKEIGLRYMDKDVWDRLTAGTTLP